MELSTRPLIPCPPCATCGGSDWEFGYELGDPESVSYEITDGRVAGLGSAWLGDDVRRPWIECATCHQPMPPAEIAAFAAYTTDPTHWDKDAPLSDEELADLHEAFSSLGVRDAQAVV